LQRSMAFARYMEGSMCVRVTRKYCEIEISPLPTLHRSAITIFEDPLSIPQVQ
jgi:hypothetical protein